MSNSDSCGLREYWKSFLVVGTAVAMCHVRARVRRPPDASVTSTADEKNHQVEHEHTATTGNHTEVIAAVAADVIATGAPAAVAETTADASTSRTPLEIDYYDLLGVSTSSTTAEIVSAYRRKAREVADLPTTDKLYVRIKKAYDVLSSESSRREYDETAKADLYQVLGVARSANLREIIVAYRKLARANHPDKGGDLRAFDMIKEAYRVLSDPNKRCDYDRNGFTSAELEKPCVKVEEFLERGRGVVSTREIGMGEVVLSRERPFAAVLSSDESAYKSYCHNCFVSLKTRRTKEKCGSCGAHYCGKNACGLHCEQHLRECCFTKVWRESDLCLYQAQERPSDKMLFLLHAVYNGGLVFEDESPLVPVKSTPLQMHVSDLFDNAGRLDKASVEQNLEYAKHVSAFLETNGAGDGFGSDARVRELIRLLRFFDTNAIPIRDDLTSRTIAKGIYLSTSLFNHSCAPNCAASFEGDIVTIRTTCLVEEGTELCLAYVDTALPRAVRQAQLRRGWRFDCACARCVSPEALECEALVHGTFCPQQDCRGQLVEAAATTGSATTPSLSEALRPNALSVSSVPYMDNSFIPSIAGYAGERKGYTFCEGRHGLGYYQEVDEWGEPVAERGDAVGVHTCVACSRAGADVHLQRALVYTAERHKFFYTHKQPALDPRVAALETAMQLNQVAHLELSCLHPFHPSVAETLRVLYRMHTILQQHAKAVQVLRVLVTRDEAIYGIVAGQTAHTSWLLADAFLRRSCAAITGTYTREDSYADALSAADWAQKAIQTMAVLYGRNHELTYAAHVTLDMAHFRIEREDRERERADEKKMRLAEERAQQTLRAGSATDNETVEPDIEPTVSEGSDQRHVQLQCTSCAEVFDLIAGRRIMACPSCGQFCTRNNTFVEIKTGDVNLESDVFGSILSSILQDVSAAGCNFHAAGDMLPTKPAPFSLQGFPRTRASTSSMAFYDPNMRSTISKIAAQHHQEWQPCSVCSMPRAAKQCAGCKVARYCSMECARSDFSNGHKELCKIVAAKMAVAKMQAKKAQAEFKSKLF